jgi:hypothetical protein
MRLLDALGVTEVRFVVEPRSFFAQLIARNDVDAHETPGLRREKTGLIPRNDVDAHEEPRLQRENAGLQRENAAKRALAATDEGVSRRRNA